MIAFLLLTVMCIGVGFAAVSDTLTVDGKVNVTADNFKDEFDGDVYFASASNAVGGETYTGVTAVVDTTNDSTKDTVKIEVAGTAFTEGKKQVKATFTITNESVLEQAAEVTVTIAGFTGENAKYLTLELDKTDAQEIAAGDSVVYTVTIKLIKIPENDLSNVAFTLTFDAVPVVAAD